MTTRVSIGLPLVLFWSLLSLMSFLSANQQRPDNWRPGDPDPLPAQSDSQALERRVERLAARGRNTFFLCGLRNE